LPKRGEATAGSAARNSIFVDSSAWIAHFSARDQHHPDVDRLFRRAAESKRPLLTTNLVLAEIHRLLLHRAGIRAAGAALDRIGLSTLVRIEFAGANHHKSAEGWLKKLSRHPITYTDAVSFAVMEAAGCREAISFDHRFLLAGFSTCTL